MPVVSAKGDKQKVETKKGGTFVLPFLLQLICAVAVVAERTGFEPAEAVNLARFPSVCLKPLDHLSIFTSRAAVAPLE